MSGVGGKNGGGQAQTKYIGIQVQSSLKGVAIPKGWGTFKAGCNLIDCVNFYSVQNSSGGKGSGGKGGGSGKGGGTTYSYYANPLMSIVGGQIYGIRSIWRDSDVFIDGTSSSTSLPAPFAKAVFSLANQQTGSSTVTSTTSTTTTSALAQAGLSLATGAIGQAVCSALTGANTTTYWFFNPNQAGTYASTSHSLGYSGLAYVYASNYALNSGATIPNHSFEVQSTIRQVIGGITQDDANPADIVNDFLPSVPQWPSGIIGSTTTYHDYCLAAGLLISPYLSGQRSGADLLQEILACSNSNAVWSQGQLQIVPYGDTALAANGATYTPNLTPVYALQLSDILENGGDDPIKWEVRPQAQCYNSVQVSYLDRTNQYVSDIMPAIDQANIDQYGLNKQDPVTLNSICLPTVAAQVAQLMVQRTANIRRTCTFKLPETFGLLDPMDLVTVPLRSGGSRLVRITEADEKDGEIAITAEEMLIGAAHAAQYTRQGSIPSASNASVDPGNASTPIVIHPPASLVSDNEIWIAACSNYPLWGGAVVWVSTDGTNYNAVGTISGPSTIGVLTSSLATYGGSNPDTTDTLAVDMSMSTQVLESVTTNDAAQGITLAIVDNELVTYQTATLTSLNHYNLTNLYRAYGGTSAGAHSSGAPIVFLNGSLFKYQFNANQLGSTLYFKLQSFNNYGAGYQNIAGLTAYTVTLAPTVSSVTWANAMQGPWASGTVYQVGDVVTDNGSSYVCTVANTAASGNEPPSADWTLLAAGGARTAVIELYQWASSVPTSFPTGTSTYTWASGTFTAPGNPNGWSLTPGAPVAGQNLYEVSQFYTDTNTGSTSNIAWSSSVCNAISMAGTNGANGSNGTNGANGTRTAVLSMYKWAAATPTTYPAGTSAYTWATGLFTAPSTTNGWSITPGAPVAGQTLWQIDQVYADTGTSTTSGVTWSSTTPFAITLAGIANANGVNRIHFSQFEAGTGGWGAINGTGVTGGALTALGGNPAALKGTATAAAASEVLDVSSLTFPATGGEYVALSINIITGTNTTGMAEILWFNSSGTWFSTSTTTATVPANTSAGQLVQQMFQVPTGTVYGQLWVQGTAVAAGAISVSFKQPMVSGAVANQTTYPAFNAGPNGFDAADNTATALNSVPVTTSQIAAGAITKSAYGQNGIAYSGAGISSYASVVSFAFSMAAPGYIIINGAMQTTMPSGLGYQWAYKLVVNNGTSDTVLQTGTVSADNYASCCGVYTVPSSGSYTIRIDWSGTSGGASVNIGAFGVTALGAYK